MTGDLVTFFVGAKGFDLNMEVRAAYWGCLEASLNTRQNTNANYNPVAEAEEILASEALAAV